MSNSSAIATAAFICALALAMAHSVALAQNNPVDFLTAHNAARSRIIPRLPPLAWDPALEIRAQNEASLCAFNNAPTPPNENRLWLAGNNVYYADDAVDLWVNEKKYYRTSTNTCSAPPGKTCDHYLRVVSNTIHSIGCAREVCNVPNPRFGGSQVYYFICKYKP